MLSNADLLHKIITKLSNYIKILNLREQEKITHIVSISWPFKIESKTYKLLKRHLAKGHRNLHNWLKASMPHWGRKKRKSEIWDSAKTSVIRYKVRRKYVMMVI